MKKGRTPIGVRKKTNGVALIVLGALLIILGVVLLGLHDKIERRTDWFYITLGLFGIIFGTVLARRPNVVIESDETGIYLHSLRKTRFVAYGDIVDVAYIEENSEYRRHRRYARYAYNEKYRIGRICITARGEQGNEELQASEIIEAKKVAGVILRAARAARGEERTDE